MKVLVDTSVWSLVLRRERRAVVVQKSHVLELRELIAAGRAVIIGPIRQEILTGIPDTKAFEQLRERLCDFPDEPVFSADFEEAARCANACRAAGIAGSPTDFLLCAVALRCDFALFTTDADFIRFSRHLNVWLHSHPRAGSSPG